MRGLKQGLTEDERFRVADDAILELKKYGDPWRLDEELMPTPGMGHRTPPDWSKSG